MTCLPKFGDNKNFPWKTGTVTFGFLSSGTISEKPNKERQSNKETLKSVDSGPQNGPFTLLSTKQEILSKKRAPSLFSVYWILTSCKNC